MLTEPENLKIPDAADFYYDGDVDEKWAIEHYLGKDIDFAEKRYYTLDPLSMVHDFTLVGARAFSYYIFGAFRYLQDPRSKGEPDVYAALPDILPEKIEEDPHAFSRVKEYLLEFCDWAIDNYQKFDVSTDIYGDVRSAYEALATHVRLKVPG